MMKTKFVLLGILLFLLNSCRTYTAKTYDFPRPVDTTTKPIELQTKKTYQTGNVFASNEFDAARLNNFKHVEGNQYQATIKPENLPINHSAYYAFKLWSNTKESIQLELNYTYAQHRYPPKVSKDGENWTLLAADKVQLAKDSINVFLDLDLDTDTLWVAAQEIQSTQHVKKWCEQSAKIDGAINTSIGQSKLGKPLLLLDIGEGEPKEKDIIVVLSRQHPPEVTGYFAMQAFIDEILKDKPLSNSFRKKYRLLVFPLMNPDGVDLGHWRHSSAGIDLNRDWAYYHQPENQQIANYIVKTAKKQKSNVVLGLDFHSTWWDVYYTNKGTSKHLPKFKDAWLWNVHQSLGEPNINERSSNLRAPVSKGWFHTQFGAVGVTYEIGDDTPRDFIKKKGSVSAIEMMKLLMLK